MRFLQPQFLWLLIPWALLPLLWIAFEKRAQKKSAQFANLALLSSLIENFSPGKRKFRFVLLHLSALFALLAMARPQMGMHEEVLKSQGLDMVFLLDVSNSMMAEDMVPNRLKKAKHVIKNFLDHLSGDRVGVVAFAGSAYPAAPLTSDYEYLKQLLETLDEKSISNQGTDLPKALQVGQELIARGGVNEQEDASRKSDAVSRVIIIFSDGENTVDQVAHDKIMSSLKENSIRVYSIGMGSLKGAPIPLRDDQGNLRGYKKDSSGTMVLSKLEAGSLEAIAEKSGGKFYVASTNEGEVQEIISELTTAERSEGAARTVMVYDELYQYPLFFSVALILLFLFLREGSFALNAILLIVVSSAAYAGPVSEYEDTNKGLKSYEEKDFSAAIEHFGKAQVTNPDSVIHRFNLGDALLKSGSADGAALQFQEILKDKDPKTAAKGAYNLGKAYEASGNHEAALQAYQKGLDRLSESPEVDAEVRDRLKRALEASQQQKNQKQQDQGKNKEDQDQKNQKNNDKKNAENEKKDKKYDIPKQKPQFKAENLTPQDASRILKQLQEQEKKTQQNLMRKKTKGEESKTGKDW